MSARRIFIGDIQGCREELELLLEATGYDPSADELHPVGDLVNRGPDSAGVLRLLRAEGAGGVLGNHDLHALRVARGTRSPGRRDTLDELLAAEDREELLDWLAGQPLVRCWDDLVCVHAGLSPAWPDPQSALDGEDVFVPGEAADFATRVRHCTAEGERPEVDWPEPGPPFAPWWTWWQGRPGETRTVVYGHWARAGLVNETRVRGLDTGCVWGRQLTAWIAEEDRIVQVPARRAWASTGDE